MWPTCRFVILLQLHLCAGCPTQPQHESYPAAPPGKHFSQSTQSHHNGRVVYGPSEVPYGPLIAASGIPQGVEIAQLNDTQLINRPGQVTDDAYNIWAVRRASVGEMQCLFRPHQGIHEWVVRTTTLRVFAKN